ncbi:CotH kinase family protein [Paraliomyxa miuraensis]|uniref:CotH kinase family protein n=1 Tax=Paraliomyxa miuraensis TaxID=376150 RepID=UPI002258878D|nr:CotH kinase family protein [Paraliomyxa miuraensis]MCX4247899.1 CotH kinase family protein [Paraliomyxa miuraensis]
MTAPTQHASEQWLGSALAGTPSWVLAAILAAAASCGQDDPAPTIVDPGPAQSADELLSLTRLSRFDLRIDEASWAALEAAPKEWTPGTFEYEGEVFSNVGIRLKGNHSFRELSDKPSFKLEFDEYVQGARFLGLEGLTLNNMVVDSSMLREWIGYRVFRELDVPAPRIGYAQVFVNDEEYGLYLVLEPYDDPFLARVYDDPSGNLYESDRSADLDHDVNDWDQDEGSDHTRADLLAFSELAQLPGNAVFYGDDTTDGVVDMPRFLAFMAGETIVGQFDGHVGGHNFFVYHEPRADQWSYLPWSLDQALARRVTPYEHEGYLGYKCLHDQRCLVDYVLAFRDALPRVRELDLEAEIDQAIALTDEAMRSDPRKPYSESSVESARGSAREYILTSADLLEPQLECLVDGQEPDRDGDGFGPCFQDCNEDDPSVHFGATELCNGIDDDCSGFADDSPDCECPSIESEGRTFYLCHNRISWLEARSYCEAQGRTLARFESLEQTAQVWAAAAEIDGGRWAIGLNDRETEEDYRWLDGTAPGFDAWAEGQPAHVLDWFDCVFLRNGAWSECNCIEKGSFICSE